MSHKKNSFFKSLNKWPLKIVPISIVLLGFLSLGINIGNGNISISQSPSVNNHLSSNINYSSVNQLYNIIKQNYDGKLTDQQVLDGLKAGLAQAAKDPYTEYFSSKDAQAFNSEISGSFSGIGAEMGKNSQGQIIVVSPIAGFPASKAGLKAQDIIANINGKSTANLSVDAAVTEIRGPKDTFVTLDIVRGGNQQLSFKIKRDTITIPSVTSKILDGNIGYIQISQFTEDTASLSAKAAEQFKTSKVNGVILDLRGNPGGLVDAAVSVCNLWLSPGQTILKEKSGDVVLQTYTASGTKNTLKGIPTVVLLDGGSASASEITAGALHDNKAATIVGEKSYGKGVVQQIYNLKDGAEAKITIAKWYRPNGQNINKVGISPDKKVTISADDIKNKNDTQLNSALTFLKVN